MVMRTAPWPALSGQLNNYDSFSEFAIFDASEVVLVTHMHVHTSEVVLVTHMHDQSVRRSAEIIKVCLHEQ
jgi:hypothetical protein